MDTQRRKRSMILVLLSAFVTGFLSFPHPGFAADDLMTLQKDHNQWVLPAQNYASHRYSELNQITTTNVKDLKVAWTFSTGVLRGHEGTPLVVGDTM